MGNETSAKELKLYAELASWWPLISPPEEYEDEAELYRRTLVEASDRPPRTVLELGAGGGCNASHLKAHFKMTLCDPAPGMLKVSRKLNPECEHLENDMRTARLGREFDAVFIHDAICYMTTRDDLRRAVETAFVHLRPGGVALFAPDEIRETFAQVTNHGGYDHEDGRGVRFLEWVWDPDPADSTYIADYVYALREPNGSVSTVHDRHVEGLFGCEEWLSTLRDVGFEARPVRFQHVSHEDKETVGFVGRK